MPQLPPFCPNKACRNHQHPQGEIWYKPFGWYVTKAMGKVKRYACLTCGKSFSEQTFRLSYYLHLHIDFRDIFYRISACEGVRAMARYFQVTDKVIANRVGRLARQAIGVMAGLRSDFVCQEPLAADGFESFIRSQYSPNNIHHLIGSASQYVHACDLAHIRRKGRMTAYQKQKRSQLERGERSLSGEIFASFDRLCHTIREIAGPNGPIVLHTDEKKEYRAVLTANRCLEGKVRHLTTSSRKARTFRNPLWAVNYYDRELRKDQAAHVRETTRWSQETNNCLERLYVYAGYHNFFKPFRIKQRDTRSHAEVAGFDKKKIERLLRSFFTRRFFFTRVDLNISEWLVWLRGYSTPFRACYQSLPAYVTGGERSFPMAVAA
jgi:hypothetical protein